MASENRETEGLEATLKELKVLNSLLDRISRIRETNHIMQEIIAELIRATDADQGIINLVSPAKDTPLETVVRDRKPETGGLPYKVGEQISGWVLKNRKMLKVDDLDDDDRFPGLSSDNGRNKAILCFPMIVRNEIIGLTTLVRSAGKKPFGDDQCRLAGILSSQSAQILNNAMLLEELARKNELLEVSQKKLKAENMRLQGEVKSTFAFENIIGKSSEMKNVLSLISRFCANDSSVLITGETGTGKELIARAIHYNSHRHEKPFVIKNCGIKTETLLESELFGHVKGSFTGAVRDKIGLFKEADGGTIFLDEIGDAPPSVQAAILRVIQSGEFRAVGSSKTECVDVRVISATNKDLKEEIKKGDFREDLFYRLNTFLIEIPPLRERRDDIPLLVEHFLRSARIKSGREDLSMSGEAVDLLCGYAWPGNVRQLENEIERAAVVCGSTGIIEKQYLSPELLSAAEGSRDFRKYRGKLRDIVENIEKEIIASAMTENDNNILRTSKILGLTRKGLKDKMARYGIDTKEE
jgi:transcriptional regulator with GAF, ATPase, and Fis domain